LRSQELQEFKVAELSPGKILLILTPEPLFRDRDWERNQNRQSHKEGRVVGIIAGPVIAPAIIAAMPISTVVASVGVVSVAAMIPSVVVPVIIVPVVIPSRMNGSTSVDSRVPGVDGIRIS
jgi:hypothetical protein